MIVFNLTPNRVACTNEENSRLRFSLMPRGHEKDSATLNEETWGESLRLAKLEKKGLVKVDRTGAKRSVGVPVPDMDEFNRAQRAMINALVLGTDAEYQAYIDMLPMDNRREMPERTNWKYVRDKMIPAFKVAADWLHELDNKKREKGVRDRMKELSNLISEKA